MSKSRPNAGGRGRTITSDEAELWQRATRSLERLKSKPRVSAAALPAAKPAAAQLSPRQASAVGQSREGGAAAAAGTTLDVLDRRQARRIAVGRADIDGCIDLHGLRQAEAQARLRAFLYSAHAKGLKTVLVITGKGTQREALAEAENASARSQSGVLRRSLPLWLAGADLSHIVLSYAAAGTRHGGAGAFYVRLRKSPRSG